MLVITDDSTREDLAEALAHLSHRAGRMTIADADYPAIHAAIDDALTAWQSAS